jgi:hypothetical protein
MDDIYITKYLNEYEIKDCGCKRQYVWAGSETFQMKTQRYIFICEPHLDNIHKLSARLRQVREAHFMAEANGLNEEFPLDTLMAAVYHSLTTGNNMTGGNYAFLLLCEKLGIDSDDLPTIYTPDWIHHRNGTV